jgi:hypothetical protein
MKEKKYEFFVLDNRAGIFYNVVHKSNEGKKTCMTRSESRWSVRTGTVDAGGY